MNLPVSRHLLAPSTSVVAGWAAAGTSAAGSTCLPRTAAGDQEVAATASY